MCNAFYETDDSAPWQLEWAHSITRAELEDLSASGDFVIDRPELLEGSAAGAPLVACGFASDTESYDLWIVIDEVARNSTFLFPPDFAVTPEAAS